MPRAKWPHLNDRPCIEIELTLAQGGQTVLRRLLADTGAGSRRARFELLLDEDDCLMCGGNPTKSAVLGGAYSGLFPSYTILVAIPSLGFAQIVRAVAIPSPPAGFDGIACFSLLNRFHYGNFGNPDEFGLES